MPVRIAAIEAGKRRLRPVFLTAMAAAIGVLPMILSGSSLWSPLASVIAFGVTWSMIMALLTVPVLYVMLIREKDFIDIQVTNTSGIQLPVIPITIVVFLLLCSYQVQAQEKTRKMNLQQLQDMAIQHNHLLKIKEWQITEKKQVMNEELVKLFPSLTVNGMYQYNTQVPELTIAAGSFGSLPPSLGGGGFPASDKKMEMSLNNTMLSSATFYQPISQIPKINTGIEITKNEMDIEKTEALKVKIQIKEAVEKLYYGLLITDKQMEEATKRIDLEKAKLRDAENAVEAGKTTHSTRAGAYACLADEEQKLLKLKIQDIDYLTDLKRLTGIPDSVVIKPESLIPENEPVLEEGQSGPNAFSFNNNPDIKITELALQKSVNAVKACEYNYLPDFGLHGGYMLQKGYTFYPSNIAFIGLSLKWNVQDIFSNNYVKKQRLLQKKQAGENLAETKEQISGDLSKAHRKIEQSTELVNVARKVVQYRKEDLKIKEDMLSSGLCTQSDYLSAKADLAKAESDFYAAWLGLKLAETEQKVISGTY